MQILASSYTSCISCVFIFSFGILQFINKWCHASFQPLLYCSKLMHNKQSCGRWKAWHHGCWCITAVVCLSCACFGNEVAFFGIFHFLTCCLFCLGLQTGSFSQSQCQYLVWWITHERLVLRDILFSRKMSGSLMAVEKIREIRVLWRAGWCLKTNLLCRAFSKAFELRNRYSSVTTQFLALHFMVAMSRIFLPLVCNCKKKKPSRLRTVNWNLTVKPEVLVNLFLR